MRSVDDYIIHVLISQVNPRASSQQPAAHLEQRKSALQEVVIKDQVTKKAFSSSFFCYCIAHFNQSGQITLFIKIHLSGQVCSLEQPPEIQRCAESCSGEWFFFAQAAVPFDNLPKYNTVFYYSHYPPTSSQLAQTLPWREGVTMRYECLLPNMTFMLLHQKYIFGHFSQS